MKEMYLKHWKNNDWYEDEEQDVDELLDLEQKIYLEMSPYKKAIFEDKDDDINEVEIVEVTIKKAAARLNGKTVEEYSKPTA